MRCTRWHKKRHWNRITETQLMSKPMSTPTPTSRLHQINATFVPLEDRIRLMVNTNYGQEFRFWITRRYLGLLWQALARITATFATQRAPTDPLLQSMLADFSAAKAVNEADMKTPYVNGSEFPLGEDPVLLTRITIGNAPHNQQLLRLLPERGQGIDLTLNDELTHLITNVLRHAATAAEWGIDFEPMPTSGLTHLGNAPLRLH
jgi:hypothetical protein